MLRAITSVERKCSWLIQLNLLRTWLVLRTGEIRSPISLRMRRHGCSRLPPSSPNNRGVTGYLPYRRLPLLPQGQLEETGKNRPSFRAATYFHCSWCSQLSLAAGPELAGPQFRPDAPAKESSGYLRSRVRFRNARQCSNIAHEVVLCDSAASRSLAGPFAATDVR